MKVTDELARQRFKVSKLILKRLIRGDVNKRRKEVKVTVREKRALERKNESAKEQSLQGATGNFIFRPLRSS